MDVNPVANDIFAGTSVENCYQCGKCTAGCPLADQMDITPNQLFRLVQLGEVEKAARCGTIWLCVSCFTCTGRCPQSVECVEIIDALREYAAEHDCAPPDLQRVILFQKAFLDNIRRNGRINEVELIGEFKTRGFLKDLSLPFLMKDALLAPKLMQRGKFHLMGEKSKDRDLVRRIFSRCTAEKTPVGNAQGDTA